jgi:hypothetical protein
MKLVRLYPSPVLVIYKVDTSCGFPLRVVRVFAIERLFSVGALLARGIIKFYGGRSFHSSTFPLLGFLPLHDVRCWCAEARVCFKGGSIGI